jgi:hypothetical protein
MEGMQGKYGLLLCLLINSFLLAKYQLDHILSSREPKKRMNAVDTVPKDMSAAYKDVIRRIETSRPGDRELAMRILSWVFHAKRTLRMDELLEALVIEDADPDEGKLEVVLQDMIMLDEVVECCKSLVFYEKTSGLVRFTHYTVQEFIAGNIQQDLLPTFKLAETCLAYLAYDEFKNPCNKNEAMEFVHQYKFSSYAVGFWAYHTRGEAEERPEVQTAILRLAQNKDKMDAFLRIDSYIRWTAFETYGQTLFHVFAENGLATTCRLALDGRQFQSDW